MKRLTGTLILWLATLCAPALAEITEYSQQSLLEANDQVVLIDVRTRGEYDSGHIPGAINIPFDAIRSQPGMLDQYRDRTIVTYCMKGGRAYSALESLEQAGYTKLGHLQGDYLGWTESQLPTE